MNSCSPTLMTNLSPVDNGRSYTRQTNSSQVNGNGKTKSKDERENRRISKTSGNVVLTCLGEGSSLSDATASALRNGIEQTYGAFVSSNTTILNDKIVKDEIVSVSSGNIVAYEIKSQNCINNKWNVVIQAEISQSKLASFAKSKGASVDINTSALAQNIKLARFYRQNEEIALNHLKEKIEELIPFCYDFVLKTEEPVKIRSSEWRVDTWLGYRKNSNYWQALDLIHKTLESLDLSDVEIKNLKQLQEGYTLVYKKNSECKVLSSGVEGDHYTIRSHFPFDIYGISCGYNYIKARPVIDVYLDYLLYRKVFDNYILYRNGIDITADLSKIKEKDLKGGYMHYGISVPDDFYKITSKDRIRTEIFKISFKCAVDAGWLDNYATKSSYLSDCDGWFCIYRVKLTFAELEKFNANYQIHSKVQK